MIRRFVYSGEVDVSCSKEIPGCCLRWKAAGTVLCIDDDLAIQHGIARLLKLYGYSVET